MVSLIERLLAILSSLRALIEVPTTLPHQYMPDPVSSFIICGHNLAGEIFRPSDWSERLCGVMTCFAPNMDARDAHLKYSRYVYPIRYEDKKAVFVDLTLEVVEPLAYRFLIDFARDNRLAVVPVPALEIPF